MAATKESSNGQFAESDVTYEQLALIEEDLEDVETEMVRVHWQKTKDLFAKRSEAIGRIPLFWTKVIMGAPTTLEEYFNMTDSTLFEQHLTNLDILRFELDADPEKGDPRSFTVKLTFSENEYFEDEAIEKKFWYRYGPKGWMGLVSEPVKIHWKQDKDLTEGLLDASIALWEARKTAEAKDPDVKQETLPEYEKVVSVRDKTSNDSFFRFFGFVSEKRFVSAEESAKEFNERMKKRERAKQGEIVEPDEEELEDYDQAAEIMAEADDVATSLAEDIYPNAIKYFLSAQSMDEAMSDDFDMEDDDEDDDTKPVDIRALVGKKDKDSPPQKKRKT